MGSDTAVAFGLIVESSIGVYCEDHAAGTVDGTVVGIGGNIIKELGDCRCCCFCCCCLLGSNGIERDQEFVVDGSCIIKESSYDALNTFDSSGIKRCAGVIFHCRLKFGAILNFTVFVR